MMRKVFISILNFNGKKNTLECLKSIDNLNTDGIDLSVVVIDNGSKELLGLKDNLLKNATLKVILNKKNLGFSAGHNLGIKYALLNNADCVVILNNDTVLDKNLVYELVRVMDKDSSIGIVSPKIYFAEGFEFHKARYKKEDQGHVLWYAGGNMDWNNILGKHIGVDEVDKGQYDKNKEMDFASGCCMMIRREVFEEIEFLDDQYFLYYEDNDFSQRVKRAGYKIEYAPKAVLWHKNAGSSGGSGSKLQDYYITRNRLLFGSKYASFKARFALLRESVKLLVAGRYWQKKGVLDFYLRRFGQGSYK
ncbi:MAG: glycosyltransferase family 2 protein [Patescibacteria group bacterium]|nr:glycosyltransferase family 2 protein [Patescibacteria group bacterium]